jgi:RsiW-degrading membrane proteinase PrsW (M82 family)
MYGDALIINSIISALLLGLILFLDMYEKEYILSIGKAFVISIVVTSFFANIKSAINFPDISPHMDMFLKGAVLEEILKFSILFFFIKKLDEIDESFDVIVYVAAIAIGFSFYEDFVYYINYTFDSALLTAVTKESQYYNAALFNIFLARVIPGHLLFDISAVIVLGNFMTEKYFYLKFSIALIIAIILHGLWNFLAIVNTFSWYIYLPILFSLAGISCWKLLKISRYNPKNISENDKKELYKKNNSYGFDFQYYLLAIIIFLVLAAVGLLLALFVDELIGATIT